MKKNEFILIATFLVIFFLGIAVVNKIQTPKGTEVVVTVDGKEFGTYPLDREDDIAINETNHLVIKEGVANMIEANCPDKLCVVQKEISKMGETIVCLPNKVIIEVR